MTLDAALRSLIHGECLERVVASPGLAQTLGGSALPVYVAHARHLLQRRRALEIRLQAVRVHDLTFVLCVDADEVAGLSAAHLHTLHPEYARTTWSPARGLSNGTLSLALKHRLAHWDILQRKLPAALVIEDDAMLPHNLWDRLATFHIPADADLFFLGSYSKNPNPRMTLASAPQVALADRGACLPRK